MADIQPKNTDTIRVNKVKEKTAAAGITLDNTVLSDTINEKTAANGVRLNSAIKVLTTGSVPLTTTIDLGTSTSSEHFRTLYAKNVKGSGQTLAVQTDTANDLTLGTNATVRLTLTGAARSSGQAGVMRVRLGHAGFTSGGEIERFTVAGTTSSTSPVTLFTYTLDNTNTGVVFHIDYTSRDSVVPGVGGGRIAINAQRAGAGALAGAVGTAGVTIGTQYHTFTTTVSGNDVIVRIQNASGTNATYLVAEVSAIPVSTNS